jgi:hypothetical protein
MVAEPLVAAGEGSPSLESHREALNASATGEARKLWRELTGHVRDVVDGVDLVARKTEDTQQVVVVHVNAL